MLTHLDLGTDPSKPPTTSLAHETHPPQDVDCLDMMLYCDEIIMPRAAGATAIPATENKGDG